MKRTFIIFTLLLGYLSAFGEQVTKAEIDQAYGVVRRVAGKNHLPKIKFEPIGKVDGCDRFEQQIQGETLIVKGSSGVALSRGFYDFVRKNGYGMTSWSGSRMEIPQSIAGSSTQNMTSKFRHHYYFNVVTYGYSMPYWDWKRWEDEIDWMALHGVDMPLALVANEAITARVWKKLGLTDDEIANYFVGPAHLPWMRMGNISGIDGPMPQQWHNSQVDLQHKILKRMKGLGMKPICPGFAGFVPKSMTRIFPNVQITETSWGGAFHNWMLSPKEKLFQTIGKMFIEEWEKEFGKNDYYIVDSFNEMDIPFPPKDNPERYKLMSSYGDAVYSSIRSGNPDAVWVMQGWMFGYQRDIWDYETLQALVSKVPDDKMLLLDLAVDYNRCFWKSEVNWEFYKGFYNKPWVYSVIPNMGGKSGLTGILSFYANGQWDALSSANKGRLDGFGMAPEGIENNEVIYELLADAGWSDRKIDLNSWLDNYSRSRYGAYPAQLAEFWNGMQKSVYGSFTDHPRYNWQFRPGSRVKGSINANEQFYQAIEQLCAIPEIIRSSKLFTSDFQEWAVAYLGGKMEILIYNIESAYSAGNVKEAQELENRFVKLMTDADRLLVNHPTSTLQNWIDKARKQGANDGKLANYYEKNARRIVTIWGPPVDDYAARIWSGLMRDYYLPRWQAYFEQKKTGIKFNFANWERRWVEEQQGLSPVKPYADVVGAAIGLIQEAKGISVNTIDNTEIAGNWTSADIKAEGSVFEWSIPFSKISKAKGLGFVNKKGETGGIAVESVVLTLDGRKITLSAKAFDVDKRKELFFSIPEGATGNNECKLIVRIRSNGTTPASGWVELLH